MQIENALATRGEPAVSVVVPGLNEAESLPELAERIARNLEAYGSYEIIFVDDGSTDDSWQVIGKLSDGNPHIHGIRLRANFGKAMALSAGFQRARGRSVVMMDADLQDDPDDLGKFLEKLDNDEFDVVVGWKVARRDSLNRRIFSRIFNGTVGLFTGVRLHDMNCGFKAYRREVLRSIPIYGDLFRFIPVLAKSQGYRVGEIPITHHARKFGRSRYGLERILRGFFDLMSVVFLTRYSRKPMHLFGLLGLLMAGGGTVVCVYLTVLWFQGQAIGHRPLLLLGVLMLILGIQFFSLGLIGEFMTFQHQRKDIREDLPIREVIGDGPRSDDRGTLQG
jgi:glycosyltransferase involved in cell wall biosynthesis